MRNRRRVFLLHAKWQSSLRITCGWMRNDILYRLNGKYSTFLYLLISVSGAAASYAFGKVLDGFAGYCFFYSHTTFDISVKYLTIDYSKAKWETKSEISLSKQVKILARTQILQDHLGNHQVRPLFDPELHVLWGSHYPQQKHGTIVHLYTNMICIIYELCVYTYTQCCNSHEVHR